MGFNVELLPTKEEVLIKSDDECREQAELFKAIGGVYYDPEFLPNDENIGPIHLDYDKLPEYDLLKGNNLWNAPHDFPDNYHRVTETDEWHVWNDPWPFHVCQGNLGNCWLIAAIQAISRRKELLEQIIPKRDWTMQYGIVQIRLCIDGEWKVLELDYHLPPARMEKDRFAAMPRKQTWIAFLEKAIAKIRGSFAKLTSGCANEAFEYFTGCKTRYLFPKNMEIDELWEQIVLAYSSGFLMTASTPDYPDGSEEEKRYDSVRIVGKHGYSIQDIKEHEGDRLILLGNPGPTRWNGKWSELPVYEPDVMSTFVAQDLESANKKLFWIGIEDFVSFFFRISICEYREGWNERRYRQTIKWNYGNRTQILRIEVQQKSEIVIEATRRWKDGVYKLIHHLFLNIHRSNSDNELGEIVASATDFSDVVGTEPFRLDPGVYLVVVSCFGNLFNIEWNWAIRSSISFDHLLIDFVQCPFSYHPKSVQQFIAKNGKINEKEEDDVIIYTWHGQKMVFIMVDNYWEYNYVRVSSTVDSPSPIDKFGAVRWSWPVPPMSRCIIGCLSYSGRAKFVCDLNIQYRIWSRLFNFANWLDSKVRNNSMLSPTLLEK